MKGVPSELIYMLVFVAIVLLQYLMKRRGSQAPPEPAPDAMLPRTLDEARQDLAELDSSDLKRPSMPESVPPPVRPHAPLAADRARRRGRFARQTLMGTRRDVQAGVVIAAILGPCRALEPPDRQVPDTECFESAVSMDAANQLKARPNR